MKEMDRRQFIKTGIRTGVAIGSWSVLPQLFAKELSSDGIHPDISIVNGGDYYNNTLETIRQLGGIERFIKKGDSVGLLANSVYKKPGAYTRPDIVLAVAHLCLEAGAGQVYCLKNESEKYWRRSPIFEAQRKLISNLKEDNTDHRMVDIPNGKVLKEAKVLGGFLEYDKVINIPILKNHGEIRMTCTLKNTMGISAFSTNVQFHTGPNIITGAVKALLDNYHDKEYLAQCIADLNLVRKFDLYVVDATEFITTNGPYGPGKLSRLNKVVAGTDPVAVDAFCCRYLKLEPEKELMIKKAYQNHLGEINLKKLNIREI